MVDYNRRFSKAPRHDFNAHRPLTLTDDLDAEVSSCIQNNAPAPYKSGG